MSYTNSYAKNYMKSPTINIGAQMRAERLARNRYRLDAAKAKAQAIKRAEEERRNAGFFTRAASTVGDVIGNVGHAMGKGIEGIVDIGAGVVGGIGGLFNSGFKDDVQSFIQKDHVGDSYGKWLEGATKYSYLNDNESAARIVRGVAQGVGGMLPSIAVSAVNPALGMATFMASAAGNNTEQAYNDGADYYSGLGYGLASGVIEGGIEKLSGGIGGSKMGKVLGKQLGKSTLGKLGITMVGEGLEEVASDLINPALKGLTGTKSWKDVGQEYKEVPSQLPMTFAIGGLTGLAMGGAGRVANNILNKNKTTSELNKPLASNTYTGTAANTAQDVAATLKPQNSQPQVNMRQNPTSQEDLTQAVKNGTMSEGLLKSPQRLSYNPIPQIKSYAQKEALKTVNILSEKGDKATVLTYDLPKNVNAQRENGVTYINANLPQSAMIKSAAVHEFTHSVEGTNEYAAFANT